VYDIRFVIVDSAGVHRNLDAYRQQVDALLGQELRARTRWRIGPARLPPARAVALPDVAGDERVDFAPDATATDGLTRALPRQLSTSVLGAHVRCAEAPAQEAKLPAALALDPVREAGTTAR
jgi:hypothetical protein